MEFHAAKCPNCGGNLRLPNNRETAKCMYCEADIMVRDAIRAVGNRVDNLMKLASSASKAGNYREAYD